MVVKGEDNYSASERLGQIEKRAKRMSKEQHCWKYECTIDIMSDEIITQDKKIRDMANTIDRLEAALSNVLNERDQLLSDLHDSNMHKSCEFCIHNYNYYDDGGESAECFDCEKETNDKWTWRGVPVKETQSR